jgi:hypothetical protein
VDGCPLHTGKGLEGPSDRQQMSMNCVLADNIKYIGEYRYSRYKSVYP